MITKENLIKISAEAGFKDPSIIEKDYALTWTLKAIYENPKLYKSLKFKGGTCLSKVYAENYRLSEDLDFSTTPESIPASEIQKELETAFDNANKQGAPQLTLKLNETHSNPGFVSFQAKYTGPLGPPGRRIKIEISLKERTRWAPAEKFLKEQNYPDITKFKIQCYTLLEILIEKIRASMQRSKSRDYYDVWQITTKKELQEELNTMQWQEIDWFKLRKYIYEKCGDNEIKYEPELIFDETRLNEAEKYWNTDLKQLVKNLPEFRTVISELKQTFYEEAELAQFNTSLDATHLRNIARTLDKTTNPMKLTDPIYPKHPILERGIAILSENLDAKDIKQKLKAIKAIDEAASQNEELFIQIYGDNKIIQNKLVELTKDKDTEIKNEAERALNKLKRHTQKPGKQSK